ncbi:VaFE repeat-containing surface-anchored protein [Adlercreutzia murintestinalis]|uniref:VaFE repeat-containing surface-anchored protein n=1 Tax=Adlercreutzia murintestinalis TaxID=2941325 RepID=UPI00203F77BA|nr:VaFE repeat-containing surface-anchored protein [Adlercreutzia murintestinalis]
MAKQNVSRAAARMRWWMMVGIAIALIIGLIPKIPLGAQEAYAGGYAQLDVGGSVPYGGYETHRMSVEGTVAYCGQPSKATPLSGTYRKDPITPTCPPGGTPYDPSAVAAALWFGYGGPGFDTSMWPRTWFDGTAMTADRYLALTHIIVADFYACDGAAALSGCSADFREWAGRNVLGYWVDGPNYGTPQNLIFTRGSEVPEGFRNGCFQMSTGSDRQVILSFVPGGWVSIAKRSANTTMTDNNPCYSLEGAQYGIYHDRGCANLAATLKLDENGQATSGYLGVGIYYVRETKAPVGYALDERIYAVSVESGQTARVNGGSVADAPQCAALEMLVAKIDTETREGRGQGGATLADAQFTVRFYPGHYTSVAQAEASGQPQRSWTVRTDEHGCARLDESHLVSSNGDFFFTSDGKPALPLGTALVQETKAPTGYHLSDTSVHLVQLTAHGSAETAVSYHAPTVADQVYRGDVQLVKARESDQNRLAGVPFRITCNTTGESHVIVTDANGQAATQSTWNQHSRNTNANDRAIRADGTVDETKLDATCGIWFGKGRVDDSRGALPYGTYTIEELPVAANAGLALIRIPSLTIDEREGHLVDLGTLDNQAITEVSITTAARERTSGSKSIGADPQTTIIDRVSYAHLDTTSNTAYELRASLVDALTGEALHHSNGDAITGHARFTPTQPNGYAEVVITFDSRAQADRDVTVYEELVRCDTGAVVAEHKDAADYAQTVHIKGQILRTTASDTADDDKLVSADPEASITDRVTYRNLIAGEAYTLEGSLWIESDEDTGDSDEPAFIPLCDAQGTPYRTEMPFVPEYEDGTVEVAFTCDTTAHAGKRVVVFERLLKDGQLIVSHEDSADQNQTVTVCAPRIATVATDFADGDDVVASDGSSTVVDAISYTDLIPGKEYRLEGSLMVKSASVGSDGTPFWDVEPLLDQSGSAVRADTTFTPDASTGQTQVRFDFDSSSCDGRDLVVYEKLYRNDTLVAEDEDPSNEDQSFSVRAAELWTVLGGADAAAKNIPADSEAAFIDQISYADAVAGGSYTVYGLLVNAESGAPILQYHDESAPDEAALASQLMRHLLEASEAVDTDKTDADLRELFDHQRELPRDFDGDALRDALNQYPDLTQHLVMATNSFTAESTAGSTELEYRFDARGLEGTRATSMVMLVKDNTVVSQEMDLTSTDQTVTFVIGTIATRACDATDGDQVLLNSASARIRDEVAFEGLTSGKEYVLEGVLYDRATASPLLIGDKQVTATASFVAAAEDGTTSVEFSFDASRAAGKQVVVYEYLYRNMETTDGHAEKVLVAQHADLNAAEQTVSIEGTGLPGTGYDKTGDAGTPGIALGALGALGAFGASLYGIQQIRRRNREADQSVQRALRRG